MTIFVVINVLELHFFVVFSVMCCTIQEIMVVSFLCGEALLAFLPRLLEFILYITGNGVTTLVCKNKEIISVSLVSC